MSETGFRARATLAGGVTAAPLPEGALLLLLGRAGGPAPDVAGARPIAPGQWLLTGAAAADPGGIAARLPDFAVVDQGHGRVGLGIAGHGAAAMLARGTGVDPDVLAVGATAATMLGPISVILTKVEQESFELYVSRSFAESLREEIEAMLP